MPWKKSDTAIPFCKVCFSPIKNHDFVSFWDPEPLVCPKCRMAMNPRKHEEQVGKWKAMSFYVYDEMIQTMLYQLKGCGDYEMAKTFLHAYVLYLRWRYRAYVLVPAPSFKEREETRGFNQVEAIFEELKLPFCHAVTKLDNVKQADLHWKERQDIGKHIVWNPKANVVGKRVLFVDDLLTTGATAKAVCRLLEEHKAKEVRILVMARTPKKEVNGHQKLKIP